MKTQYFTATSLDGFIATEDDSLDWLFPLGNVNDTRLPQVPRRSRCAGDGRVDLVDASGQVGSGFAELRYQLKEA